MNPDEKSTHSIRTHLLTGDAEQRYSRRFAAIVRAARLNDQYPSARRLAAHIRAMDPDVHRGAYDGLQINIDSGLPTYREWTRVQTDVNIAAEQLAILGDRSTLASRAAESSHEVHTRQLDKFDYFNAIADTRLAPLGEMNVALRRVDAAQSKAFFRITFDKLDVSGIFVRYLIDLTQTARVWNTAVVRLDEETATHTDEFQSLIYKFSSMDSEFTYARLAALSGIEVQRVSRGTVGPFYFSTTDAPEPFDALLGNNDDAFVAMFAIDASADDISEHRNNDPFGALFENELSKEMRPKYSRARQTFGYQIYKDRKFVVSQKLQGRLREICAEMGTKNIIYAIGS